MYVWFVIALCLLAMGAAIVAALLSKIMHIDYIAVKIYVIRAKRNVIQKRTLQSKTTLKCTLAAQPIRLKCGVFYWIGNQFFA